MYFMMEIHNTAYEGVVPEILNLDLKIEDKD